MKYKVIIVAVMFFLLTACNLNTSADNDKRDSNEDQLTANTNIEIKELQDTIILLEEKNDQLKKSIKLLEDEHEELYFLRNEIDNIAHKIYFAMINKDLDYIGSILANGVELTVEGIFTPHDNTTINHIFDNHTIETHLRQRAYYLNDKQEFISIYEVLVPNAEQIPTLDFKFIKENDEWKLWSIISN